MVLWRYEKQWCRNVQSRPGPHAVTLVLDRLKADFNVPKIFRSAEAFGAHAVHLMDVGPFDPAPAKGGFKHVPDWLHDTFDACLNHWIERGSRSSHSTRSPTRCCMKSDFPIDALSCSDTSCTV
jgi:tRNA G18 (ribose-2'-O)-methylase SpoU